MSKSKVPSRSWPVAEERGWQQSEAFFRRYATRKERREFYQKREALNREVREGLRRPNGLLNEPYDAPLTSEGAW